MPGGPTAYGGTKPGPAAGGDAGIELATVLTVGAGADAGAEVGVPAEALTATGLLVTAGKLGVCGVGAAVTAGTGAA
jgi:hypothetical protein